MRSPRRILFACTLLTAQVSFGATHDVCREFAALVRAPSRYNVEKYAIQPSLPIGGKDADVRLFNVDIDGDDISDEVALDCPSSSEPADGCLLTVKLSSGPQFSFNDGRFFMLKRHSFYYLLVTKPSEKDKRREQSLYKVDATGVSRICASL